MNYLTISNLNTCLGNFTLGPINLTCNKGDYLILLGPTGCGKSTFLHCLAGAIKTDSETILLNNTDIGRLTPHKRMIGYVVQHDNLFPHMTVKENIAFGLNYLHLTVTKKNTLINQYLNLFQLEDKASNDVTTLSGGEKRRVGLARSLITKPKLLLLDEPLSMLDHNGRLETLSVLKLIHDELQTTTIHVTHDRMEAWSIADQCAVMNNGRLLQTGTVDDLFRKPAHRFTSRFLGNPNCFPVKIHQSIIHWFDLKFQSITPFTATSGYLLIRPELIELSKSKTNFSVKGTILSIHDFGSYNEVILDITNHQLLTVHVNKAVALKLAVNDLFYAGIDPENTHIIQDQPIPEVY